jgi:hypothetical protein
MAELSGGAFTRGTKACARCADGRGAVAFASLAFASRRFFADSAPTLVAAVAGSFAEPDFAAVVLSALGLAGDAVPTLGFAGSGALAMSGVSSVGADLEAGCDGFTEAAFLDTGFAAAVTTFTAFVGAGFAAGFTALCAAAFLGATFFGAAAFAAFFGATCFVATFFGADFAAAFAAFFGASFFGADFAAAFAAFLGATFFGTGFAAAFAAFFGATFFGAGFATFFEGFGADFAAVFVFARVVTRAGFAGFAISRSSRLYVRGGPYTEPRSLRRANPRATR